MNAARTNSWTWPAEALPAPERMSDWLRIAMADPSAVEPSRRNRIYKARVIARKALAMAKGDMAYALAIAQLGEAEFGRIRKAAGADPKSAREATARIASGEIGYGKIGGIIRGGLTQDAIAAASVPQWPLEAIAPDEIRRDTRWDALEPARRASGLSSHDFATLHGLPATYVRKCTMLMTAARRLADGKPHRARRILRMSHIRILNGDKAVRSGSADGRALIAYLDRTEAEDEC